MNKLILVSGRPGTGKTFISNKIIQKCSEIKLISYDELKENLYDDKGFSNLEEKEKLNYEALQNYFIEIEKNMKLKKTIISDYPFSYKQRNRLLELSICNEYKIYSITLVADSKVLIERIRNRDISDERHLGHIVSNYYKGMKIDKNSADCLFNIDTFEKISKERNYDNFCLGDNIKIDTTYFENIDFECIYKFLDI